MPHWFTAGLAYFALVFAVGFGLGTARVLLLAPRLGETGAVVLELPVMLAVSWFAAGWIARRFAVPPDPAARLAMGGVAFLCLMAAEAGVATFGFGRSVAEHLAGYAEPARAAGLAAQVAFALMPWWRGRRS